MDNSEILFSKIIKDTNAFSQWRVTVSDFRGVQYLNIREYFLDFEGEWLPTKKGISVALELEFTKNLFDAISQLLSEAEKS